MSVITIQKNIVEEMNHLGDWMGKYEYLIGLGKNHPSMDAAYKIELYAIPGCQSSVWIVAEQKENKMHFMADSDSLIIKGFLVLLLQIYNNRTMEEISQIDLFFLKETGLITHLSPSRANGLKIIINQFHILASN